MLTFRKFLLEYATHSPESKRREKESDKKYQNRLFNNPVIQEEFKRYLMEDCLRSLESIKYLNNEYVNKVIDLIKKWLSDPKSVKKGEFRSAAPNADVADTAWVAANAAARVTANNTVGNNTAGWFTSVCAWAAFAINPNINWDNIETRKLQEYMRVARMLDSQHTKNKPTINKDNKKILISTVQNEDKHGIVRLLQDYLFPEFEEQMKEFEEYLKELYEIKGELSLDELVSLIIANKNEFILFINKFIL